MTRHGVVRYLEDYAASSRPQCSRKPTCMFELVEELATACAWSPTGSPGMRATDRGPPVPKNREHVPPIASGIDAGIHSCAGPIPGPHRFRRGG